MCFCYYNSFLSLRKKCPYSELFWSVFSRIRTEYGEILRISPYSVRMRENTDQNNSECGHFSRRSIGLSSQDYWFTIIFTFYVTAEKVVIYSLVWIRVVLQSGGQKDVDLPRISNDAGKAYFIVQWRREGY